MSHVINPVTGRKVKVGSKTYEKLVGTGNIKVSTQKSPQHSPQKSLNTHDDPIYSVYLTFPVKDSIEDIRYFIDKKLAIEAVFDVLYDISESEKINIEKSIKNEILNR